MRAWWQGTRLVAGRRLVETARSRSFKIVTGFLLLVSVAAVVVPQVVGHRATTYTLATVGDAPPALVQALDAAGSSGGFDVAYLSRPDEAGVRGAVREGHATAGLAGQTLYVSRSAGGTFPVLVAQSVVRLEAARRLAAAGLTPQQVADVEAVRPPEQVTVGRTEYEGRAGIGIVVGIVLFLALTFAGSTIATAVAMEKTSGISEVLLSVLRASQVLVGTVLAVGVGTLVQLVVLAAPLAVAVKVTHSIGLSATSSGDIVLALVWFVLGFVLYAFCFAALAALVNKVTEVSTAILPATLFLTGGYLVAITVVPANPSGPWSVAASLFPPLAPMAMPIRWASGQVPLYQLALAMALTAGTAAALVVVASAVYRRGLLITGRRARLRETVGRPADG